jgi:hypothetical protein
MPEQLYHIPGQPCRARLLIECCISAESFRAFLQAAHAAEFAAHAFPLIYYALLVSQVCSTSLQVFIDTFIDIHVLAF